MEFEMYSLKHKLSFNTLQNAEWLQAFHQNLNYINSHNANKSNTYQLGITKFTHLTGDEYAEFILRDKPKYPRPSTPVAPVHLTVETSELPTQWDWSKQGAVTPVKNQGKCGSCWIFVSTGALEGAYFVAQGKLPYKGEREPSSGFYGLSEQQLAACNYLSGGCKGGGWPESAFIWAAESKRGVTSESQYPYVADGYTVGTTYTCITAGVNADPLTAPIEDAPFTEVPADSMEAMMSAVCILAQ